MPNAGTKNLIIELKYKSTTIINSNVILDYHTYTITEVGDSYYTEKYTFSNSSGYGLTKYVNMNGVWKISQVKSYDSNGLSTTTIYSPYKISTPSILNMGSIETERYTMTQISAGSDNVINKVVETTSVDGFETISVPAGTFNAIRVSGSIQVNNQYYSASRTKGDSWYAEGIGMIKSEGNVQDADGVRSYVELYDYYLK